MRRKSAVFAWAGRSKAAGIAMLALIFLSLQAGAEIRLVTISGDSIANPQPQTFRHAVEVLAQPGDTVKFATPIVVELEGNVHVREHLAGLRIEGPGQIGFKHKPKIGEAGLQSGLQIFAHNVTVANLGFRNCFVRAISGNILDRLQGFTLTDCNFVAVGGVNLFFTTGAKLEGNTFEVTNLSRGQPAIDMANTVSTLVQNNTVETRGGAALVAGDEKNLSVLGNTFKRHVEIHLQGGTIFNNTVEKARLSVYSRAQDAPIVVEKNVSATLRVLGVDLTVKDNTVQGDLSTAEDYRWPPYRGGGGVDLDNLPFTTMSVGAQVNSVSPHAGPILVQNNTVTGGKIGFFFAQHIPTPETIIEDNKILNPKQRGMVLKVTQSALARKNTISGCAGRFAAVDVLAGTDELLIDDNDVIDNRSRGIALLPNTAARITHNRILRNTKGGILLGSSSNSHVESNVIDGNKTGGIIVNNNATADLRSNTIRNTAGPGISLFKDADVFAEVNVIENSKTAGVLVNAGGICALHSNTIRGTAGPGVVLHQGATAAANLNTIEDNAGPGMLFRPGAKGVVTLGVIRGNIGAGLTVSPSASVEISRVSFRENRGPGIDLYPAGATPNKLPKRGNANLDFPDELVFDEGTREIRGVAEPGATVELFRVESGPRLGNPRNGEGAVYVGSALATGNGMFSIPPGSCAPGDKFCLTATRPGEQRVTSEFSLDIECPPTPPIERVNVSSAEGEANGFPGDTVFGPVISDDGQLIVFSSDATNLVENDGNDARDVFLRNRMTGTTERISVSPSGGDSTYPGFPPSSSSPSISADGRWVVFQSTASNLVANDATGTNYPDVFLRDRESNTTIAITDPTTQVPPLPSGRTTHLGGREPIISADGSTVAFVTADDEYAAGGANNNQEDVYVWTRATGLFEKVSISSTGGHIPSGSNYNTGYARLSSDGRYVAFQTSYALHTGANVGATKVYLRDRVAGTTELISQDSEGAAVAGQQPSISADGRYIAFLTSAALDPADTNAKSDIYARDRQTGTNHLCSRDPAGNLFLADCGSPSLSADGRFVAFFGPGSSTRDGFTVLHPDIYIRDRQTGTTTEASIGVDGDALGASSLPSLSRDGRFLLFLSHGSNLVENDTNGLADLFIRDRAEELVAP